MVRGTRWIARGRLFDSRRRHTLSFWIFCLYPVDNSSAKTIQIKSSMTFIQSNGWTEIDLILKQIWRRFIWWQVSFNMKDNMLLEILSSYRFLNSSIGTGALKLCNTKFRWLKKQGQFVKHRCPQQQQCPHKAKSRCPTFWPCPTLKGRWY